MKKILILLITTMVYIQTIAVPADPTPRTAFQPNGEEITLIMRGDEYIHWAETLDGYTLLVNQDHYFCYAQLNASGDLEPSPYIATEIESRSQDVSKWLHSIDKKLFYSDEQSNFYMQIRAINDSEIEKNRAGTTGINKVPVILMGFPDRPFTKTAAEIDLIWNQINYTENNFKGSVKDYFLECSYNKLEVQSTIFGPYTTPQDVSFYTYESSPGVNPNYSQFAKDAIKAALDDGADFSKFTVTGNQIESVYCIYAGYDESNGGTNCIWAHAQLYFNHNAGGFLFKRYAASSELRNTSGSVISNIGTYCHEYGHVLGALDYYDINYTTGGAYDGTGDWDLQAGGSSNDNSRSPAHPNPRSKVYTYGWATAIELNTAQRCTIPVARIYENAYFRISTSTSLPYSQYFILENKKRSGFDSGLPGENLLIYRCTDYYETSTPYPGNTTSYQRFYPIAANAKVKVPEAGTNKQSQYGSINSYNCTWPTSTQTAFTDSSIPGMVTWDGSNVGKPITNIVVHDDFITFDFMGGGNKTKFNVFLPSYYGCKIIPESGSSSPVNAGGFFSFKIELLPTHNKSVLEVSANNEKLVPFGDTYTIANIQDDIIVKISGVKFNTNAITTQSGENGKITPGGVVQVNVGGLQAFEIKADNGYSIENVEVDGDDQGKITSYTFYNVVEPHTISASFVKGTLYTINTSIEELTFETIQNNPTEGVKVKVSSPNIIADVSIAAPNRFQVSVDNKNWYQAFKIIKKDIPKDIWIRFFPSAGMENVGIFDTVLTLKSTDAYAEIKLKGISLGIDDNTIDNAITIYPNPTTGKLRIETSELRIDKIDIYDIFGKIVISNYQVTASSHQELDITNLGSGVYMMAILTDKGIVHKKVVKE